MKKIIAGCLAVLLTMGVTFAADFSASVYMTGTLADGTGDGNTVNGPKVANQTQTDADMLTFTFDDKNYGASFRLWTKLDGDVVYKNDSNSTSTLGNVVYARYAMLWFKPIDMLKVSVGSVSSYLYKERLHWWKTAAGGKATDATSGYLKWSSYAGVEGGGINFTLTPIDGLTIDLGTSAGIGNFLWTVSDGNLTYNDWGAVIKYQINDAISVGMGWRDMGSDGSAKPANYSMAKDDNYYKILTTGFDVKLSNFYGLLQPRVLFNEYYGFESLTFDNYCNYSTGPYTLQARIPFIYRLQSSGEDDPSYLIYDIKASYKVNDKFSPYLELSNDDGGDYTPLCFGTEANGNSLADTFVIHVYPGVAVKVGKCDIDVGVSFNTYAKGSTQTWKWTVPFSTRVTF